MDNLKPVIKWSGSKRHLAQEIVSEFPKQIDTYYEPFVGGASVLWRLLHSDISVNKFLCSDTNSDLINLWNDIKFDPLLLIDSYYMDWEKLTADDDVERKKTYYYSVREHFNERRCTSDFLFLSRTCTNGLIRYNSKGQFNVSFHFSRNGINPKSMEKIILDWSDKLNERKIEFVCQDYKQIQPKINDFVYIDPPYANTKAMYFGHFNHEELFDWMKDLSSKYILSFNGKRSSKDTTYAVPTCLYNTHKYATPGRSSYKSLKGQSLEYVQESFYIK